MLRAVLWDFDGTICDTYPAIAAAVNAALAPFGHAAEFERIIALSSISLDGCIRTLAADYGIPFDELDTIFVEVYGRIRPEQQPPFPGVVALCQRLVEHRVDNFVVTHRRRASLTVLLAAHGLQPFFRELVTGDDGFPKKPAPDALLYLLRTYALAPEEVVLIGDRDVDILAGQAAGMPTYLFRGSFAGIVPTRAFQDYDELADLLPE